MDLSEVQSFRPLAGLSCINQKLSSATKRKSSCSSFRPLAGLSCINPAGLAIGCPGGGIVSVPSRG